MQLFVPFSVLTGTIDTDLNRSQHIQKAVVVRVGCVGEHIKINAAIIDGNLLFTRQSHYQQHA